MFSSGHTVCTSAQCVLCSVRCPPCHLYLFWPCIRYNKKTGRIQGHIWGRRGGSRGILYIIYWNLIGVNYYLRCNIDDFSHNLSNPKFHCKSYTFCSFSTPSIFNCLLHHVSLRPDWCELNSDFHILLFSFIALQLNFVKELHVNILFDKQSNHNMKAGLVFCYFLFSLFLVYFFFSHHFCSFLRLFLSMFE